MYRDEECEGSFMKKRKTKRRVVVCVWRERKRNKNGRSRRVREKEVHKPEVVLARKLLVLRMEKERECSERGRRIGKENGRDDR